MKYRNGVVHARALTKKKQQKLLSKLHSYRENK